MTASLLLSTTPLSKTHHAYKNYGVYRPATELRNNNYSCQVVQHYNYYSKDELDQIIQKYVNSDTKLIGFSAAFWENLNKEDTDIILDKTKYICRVIRKKYPDIKIIVGSTGARFVLNKNFAGLIDAIFEGFSENDFIKYIQALNNNIELPKPQYKIDDIGIYKNYSGDFDFNFSSTIYDENDLLDETDIPILEIGRGCIFKCKFCAFDLNGKKKFDYIKDPDVLYRELLNNYENFGFTRYILSDDTFNDSMYKLELLHSVFKKLPFKLEFSSFARLDLLNAFPAQKKLLKDMGLKGVFFGVETFHKEAGKLIGKSLAEKGMQLLDELKKDIWGSEIKIAIGLIQGIPYEDYDSHNRTLDWIMDDKNMVESVVPNALVVPNPAEKKIGVVLSEFQRNAAHYGFTWDKNDPTLWRNSIGPIKTKEEADELNKIYTDKTFETVRWKQGGFNMFKVFPLIHSYDNSITFGDLQKMNRWKYNKLVREIEKKPEVRQKYVNAYKKRLLQ